MVAGGTLQDVFDRGNPVFAFQPRDQVKPFFDLLQAPRVIFDVALVAADARGNILEAVDSFGQVCLVLLHIFIKPGKVAQGFERRAQLVERGPVLVTAFAAFDGPVHDGAQFAQPFRVTQHLALFFQFFYLACSQFCLLDLLDLVAQELGATGLFAFILLQREECLACTAPLGYPGTQLFAQWQQIGVAVEKVDVLFGAQQAHMLALAVNIHQPARHLL